MRNLIQKFKKTHSRSTPLTWILFVLFFISARFAQSHEIKKIDPSGIAIDSSGNIYIADSFNCLVWKINPKGVMSILAGSGAPGYINGKGTAASFSQPSNLAIDSAGSVYVIDKTLIRKIKSDGTVSTFAGTKFTELNSSFDLHTNHKIGLNEIRPMGIAVDASGNVFITDWSNGSQIRKISPAGVISSLPNRGNATEGNQTFCNTPLQSPVGIALDNAGNIYIADTWNGLIRKITNENEMSTLASSKKIIFVRSPSKGFEFAKTFGLPWGIALDSSKNIYVSDTSENIILKITPKGTLTTLAGKFRVRGMKNGKATSALFNMPKSIAVDTSGNIYVADAGNNLIRIINKSGVVKTLSASVTLAPNN